MKTDTKMVPIEQYQTREPLRDSYTETEQVILRRRRMTL